MGKAALIIALPAGKQRVVIKQKAAWLSAE